MYSPTEPLRLLSRQELNQAIISGLRPLSDWYEKDRIDDAVKRGDLVKSCRQEGNSCYSRQDLADREERGLFTNPEQGANSERSY